jgi:HK97 gp10 family phage protein
MTVRGADKLIKKLNRLPMELRGGIGAALTVSVIDMDAYAKQQISGGGRSGKTYRRRTISHQASAPGEFPKSDTGQLVSSLFFRIGADKLSAFFGTKLAYGRWLEFGTSRMRARPWLSPTLKANAEKISPRIRAAVNEAIRRSARG